MLTITTGSMTAEAFLADETLKRAVSRSLYVIGEAVWQITRRTPETLPAGGPVEWPKIVGLRHRLAHAYAGTDYRLLWNICRSDVDPLHREVLRLIGGLGGDQPPGTAE